MDFDIYENPHREKKKEKKKFKVNPAIITLFIFLLITLVLSGALYWSKQNLQGKIADVKVAIMEEIEEHQVSTLTGAVSLSSRVMENYKGLDIWPEQDGNMVTYHCTYKGIKFDVETMLRSLREQ